MIQEELFALQDTEYAAFQSKLTPNISRESIIGVRVPQLRKLAKRLGKSKEAQEFLLALPHAYYDENMLHSLLVSEIKDFYDCILSPRVFKKNRTRLLPEILRWASSSHVYTCRFGIEILMTHFLDEDFDSKYLEIPAQIHSDEYYVNMMIAWFFATALAKQWDSTLPYLETKKLDTWVHNKTIQKARESYRITAEQKLYLKSLKQQ